MITIHIEQDDAGQVTVAVDGGEPVPVQGAEGACEMVEQALGGGEMDKAADAEAAMGAGFQGVRGGGL